MTVESRIQSWTNRIDGKVKAEVIRMHHQKSAWDRVSAMLRDNPSLPPSYWWQFLFDTYASTQASAVRRQADSRRDVDSLMRLIMDVRKGAVALTRTWWIDTLWAPDPGHSVERAMAENQWREFFGGNVGHHLDPAIPEADAGDLKRAAEKVKRHVDDNIAHTSAAPKGLDDPLLLDEIHEAMETVDRLFRRYYSLLTATGWTTTTPFEQDDFYAPFRLPWMRPGYRPD